MSNVLTNSNVKTKDAVPKIVNFDEPSLTEEQSQNVKEVFNLFSNPEHDQLKISDLKIAMRALGFEPKREEIKQILSEMNKDNCGYLALNEFTEIMIRKYAEKDVMLEIQKAFELFDDEKTGFITLKNLKRVCKELGEQFRDEDLQEMIEEADRDNDGAISLKEFAIVMQKTNLY